MNDNNIITKTEEVNKFFTLLPRPILLPNPQGIISAMEEVLWDRLEEFEGLQVKDAS
jgi:hypothetical protein